MPRKDPPEIFSGVGPDVLTPRTDGDAYDHILTGLHSVMKQHEPLYTRNGNVPSPFILRDFYKNLEDIVGGAVEGSYSDLALLSWPGEDYNAEGGRFFCLEVYGSSSLYGLTIDVRNGLAKIIDHERGERRRVPDRRIGALTYGRVVYTDDYYTEPCHSHLTTGYVVVPRVKELDIRNTSGAITGDSVRAALDPNSEILESIAQDLAEEARRSAE